MDRTWLFHVLISLCLVNHITAALVATQSLLGCGMITRPLRVYPYSPANYNFNSNSPGVCMQACSAAGYAYASVSAGQLCFCGSSSANTAQLNSTTTLCQVALCSGDSTTYCGDTNYELVYTSVGVIDSASIALNGGGSPTALSVNQNYQFNVGYQGAASYINYYINFGDGTKTGWFSGTINAITTVSHIFSKAGQFSVSVSARTVVGMQPKMYAMTVVVSDQISSLDVSITCPNVTATGKTISCIFISARGTGLTANINYNTSGPSDSIVNIPNAFYMTFGSSLVTNNPTVDSSVNLLGSTDIAILPQSTITIAGRIASIQFYSSGAGTINIYLLRRSCTSPSMYCYSSNTCGTCSNPYSLQCSTTTYSTITHLCDNTTSTQRFQQSTYSSAQFQIIAQYTITTTGAGYQQIVANTSSTTNQTALVGDMLAFSGPYIAKVIPTDTNQDYRCITPTISSNAFTCTIGSLSANGTAYRYLLQTTIIQAVQIAPTMIYANAGTYNVQGTITQNNVGSFSTSTILPVVIGINYIQVVAPSSANLNVVFTVTVNLYPSTATATSFMWYINGNNTLNSTNNTMNVSFSSAGTYTIACQAQNLLSTKYNSTTTIIQDVITNFTLVPSNVSNVSISQPLDVARFQIQMATGSNYVCQINYDTTQSTTQVYFYTSGYIPGSYVTHQYLLPGVYNIFAWCSNSISNVTYSLTQYVQYPILGLQLQQQGATKNTNFCLNITISQGTSPQFRIIVNGAQVNYTYNALYLLAQTTTFSSQSSSTNFTVQIYAWNYVSSVYISDIFSIVSAISNPQISASTTNTLFPGPIVFQYTMDSGSNVNVTFSFGDTLINSPVSCLYSGDYPSGVWGGCSGTNHTFAIPGTMTVIVSFTNAISTYYKYLTVTLSTSVSSIVIGTSLQLLSSQCSAAYIGSRATASFVIQAANTTVKPASNAQVLIIPDSINQPTVTQGPFQLTFNYFNSPATTTNGLNIIYTSVGNYTAVLQVSNNVDSINVSCVVTVLPVLSQVYYTINSLNWPFNNPTPFQALVYVFDLNPGPIIFTWDFGDGTVITAARTATQPNQPDTATHRYTSIGNYILTIKAAGPVNTVTQNFTVTVQYAVSTFTVTFPGVSGSLSQLIYSGGSTTIPINIQDSSTPAATNAFVYINYNDTSPLASGSVVSSSAPYTGSYTYTSPGIFYVNVTVYNQVSSVTQIITLGINAPFVSYQFSVCYLLPTFTSPLNDICNLTVTNGLYTIPKQSQLVVYATWTNPSGIPQAFDIIFSTASGTVFTQTLTLSQATNISSLVGATSGSPLFRLVTNVETNSLLPDGAYSVAVNTRNPSYTATYTLNTYIISGIAGLVISDNNIVVAQNVQKTFVATYQNFSALSCLYIQYSDNTIQCYGDSSSCLSLPTDVSPALQACPSAVQPFTYVNSAVTFSRAFNKSSAWLFAYAWNRMTTATAKAYFSFPLTSVTGCNLPQITFNIYNPVIRWPRVIQRSQSFSVSTQITLNCSKSLNNTKQWSIYLCDTTSQICSQTPALIQLVSQLSSAKTSEIYLQGQALPLGTYLFNQTVSLTAVSGFVTSAYTYINIIQSNLQVHLLSNGTSSITNGITQSILFQPGVYTVDPDSTYFDPTTWTFDYYCRVYGVGSYPTSNGTQLTLESTIVDPLNPSCFVTPGNTSLYKYGPNNNKSILYIQPFALPAFETYEFQVIVTNMYDTTLAYAGYALVQVQTIESVLIGVECIIKMCLPNVEYQRINPTTQALVTSSCVTCENVTSTVIQWNVYSGFQTGYPNNDMKWILYSNMSAYDNILFYGRQTMNLTVVNTLFLNNPSVQYWQFESVYTVTTTNGIASGSGSIRFTINSPPQNGTCTVSQINGTTTTPFILSCPNWVDSDGIAGYTFYAVTSNNGSRTPIGFTTLTSMTVYLPTGDPNADYTIQLSAEIRDIYGAIASSNISTVSVTVDESSLSAFIQSSQSSTTQGGSNNIIENILFSGDQNTANQVVLSLSQSLNTMSASSQQSAASGNIPASSLSASGLFASTSTSTVSSTNSSENNTAATDAYTAALNTQANVRDRVIQLMGNLSITNIDSIKLQASTMSVLTGSTSEVTRASAASASSKCTDLVNALNGMVDTVSYEDAQMAVNSIAQLASNVLVSVNTPMLGRGNVLNLDYDRANQLPADYDTDIESVWSNPNLFADGDDFSWETIQNNRNLYYQQQGSNQVLGQMDDTISKAVNVLTYHMNVGQTNTIATSSISMITQKQTISNLSSYAVPQAAGAKINLPTLPYCDLLFPNQSCSDTSPITMNSVLTPLASAGTNGRSQANINMSRSVSLGFLDSTGATRTLSNLQQLIEIIIPRDPSLTLPAMTLQNVSGQNTSATGNNNRQFSLFYVNVTGPSQLITLSATFEFKSDNPALGFAVIYRFDAIPILNSSMNITDGYRVFCPADQIYTDSDGYLYAYFLNNLLTTNHTYVMFGIRELNVTEFATYCPNNESLTNSAIPITNNPVYFTSNYYIRVYTSSCCYMDEKSNWRSDNVTVGPGTSHNQTQCFSNHLTTFAGGWIVLPAPINWNYVFANASFAKNMTIYLTLILLAVIYIVFMIYARYKDKKDVEKLGVTPLPDNLVNDKYYYQIIVFTGLRKDAGTSSKVHFVLSGDDEETTVRTFEDPHRQVLRRGGIDSFIMAVPKSLGRLNYMRVWHDNSGGANKASWFLKYIVVRDLQTMEKNHFICQKWFAVEKDDGVIDRLLPVAGDEQKTEFTYLLSKKTYHSMSDGHLWFSVFSRPPSIRFTRTQRCTCCFVLLLMSMLMNIMYYDQSADGITPGGISIGPFYITAEQISIGVIVELICFLPSTILVEMFRRLRPRRRPVAPVRAALQRMQDEQQQKQQRQAAVNDIHPQLTGFIVNSDPVLSRNELDKMRNTLMTPLPDKQNSNRLNQGQFQTQKTKKPMTLPWWCIFVAYAFSFIVVAISGVFIWARGVEFGDQKTGKWLTSCVTGFVSSIFFTQPFKVVLMAIFFALIIRRDEDIAIDHEDDDDDLFLDGDEEYLHAFDDDSLLTFRSKSGHIPLTDGELSYARDRRLKEIKMWEIIREFLAYLSFLWILYVVSYSNCDPNAYFLMNHLTEDFLDLNSQTTAFTQVYNSDQYWNWLSESFVTRIRAADWYNGEPPVGLVGYMGDRSNRVLGWATMRQLRVKPDSCKLVSSFQNIISSCEAGYSPLNEDKRSFNPGWKSLYNPTTGPLTNYSSSITEAFMYNDSTTLGTYAYSGDHASYGGGGYVYEFRGKMSEIVGNISLLRELSWVDIQTRAVIIQLSLYNPNVGLFAFATILAEFLPTGGVAPSARFEPISLLSSYNGFALFKTLAGIVYMIFIIYFTQREIRSAFKRRMGYLRDFWSYPEFGIIVCSWTALGLYIWRIREGNHVGKLFQETKGYACVNLQLAAYVNDVLTYLLAFCCFFGTIKFLRLLRFNKHIAMLSSTMVYAFKDLISFAFMFSFLFLAFLALFFLLFQSKLWTCADLIQAAQMLSQMMLLKYNVSGLIKAGSFLGPFCFTLFMIFVVFICMNMFISIIVDSFRVVRRNPSLQSREYEIVGFTINQFKKWTGLGTTQEMDRLHANPYDGSHVHYQDPITSFPDKMDELIDALNKVYMDAKRDDTVMFQPMGKNQTKMDEKPTGVSNRKDKK